MDILVILGVFVAVVLILIGLYMVLQPKAVAREIAPILDDEDDLNASAQIDPMFDPATESKVEPVISANDFITQTINQHASNQSVHGLPIDHHTDQVIESEHESIVLMDSETQVLANNQPYAELELSPVVEHDSNGLDAMLDDLAQATTVSQMAKQGDIISDLNQVYDVLNPHVDLQLNSVLAIPEVIDTTQLPEWDGDSALINEHLAEHTRSEEDNILVQAEQIIAIYLLPKTGRPLEGRVVLKLLRKYGLRYGEMELFHRFEETSGEGDMMFSVLKHTADGPVGFDLDTMEHESCEGLCFFLALPGIKPLQGFDMMVSTAQRLSQECYSNLLDDEMNPLSEQLKSHYRHKVLDFRPSR